MTESAVAPAAPGADAPALDVATISRHKDSHVQMLGAQEKYGSYVLDFQINHHTKYLRQDAEQVKTNFNLQLNMEIDQQELLLTHQYDKHVLALKTQAALQKGALEMQAMQMKMSYREQVQIENMQKQQEEMEERHANAQQELEEEMIKRGIKLRKPGPQFPPQHASQEQLEQQLLMEMHLQQQHQQQVHQAEQQHLLHQQQQLFALHQQQPPFSQQQQGPFMLSPGGGVMPPMQTAPSGYTGSTTGE
eukprot:GEMP01038154.1.p1 GENE.GEMP01038154.1~~GEMP01038154.1.p1  ORF type:complete len:248 (+),score=64.34 GEMP01038154.1:199-942(+)